MLVLSDWSGTSQAGMQCAVYSLVLSFFPFLLFLHLFFVSYENISFITEEEMKQSVCFNILGLLNVFAWKKKKKKKVLLGFFGQFGHLQLHVLSHAPLRVPPEETRHRTVAFCTVPYFICKSETSWTHKPLVLWGSEGNVSHSLCLCVCWYFRF